jgi:hypothetical protein
MIRSVLLVALVALAASVVAQQGSWVIVDNDFATIAVCLVGSVLSVARARAVVHANSYILILALLCVFLCVVWQSRLLTVCW